MSQYFDKNFIKFFLGFAAIISVSLMIIFATRFYEKKSSASGDNAASAIQATIKN